MYVSLFYRFLMMSLNVKSKRIYKIFSAWTSSMRVHFMRDSNDCMSTSRMRRLPADLCRKRRTNLNFVTEPISWAHRHTHKFCFVFNFYRICCCCCYIISFIFGWYNIVKMLQKNTLNECGVFEQCCIFLIVKMLLMMMILCSSTKLYF